MADPVRMVFLGCGGITATHSRTLRALDRDVALAFASRDPAKAESYRQRFQGEAAFGSYGHAIRDSSAAVVFIATPPDSHRDLAVAAFRAGKHVIVEKPPFRSTAEFDQVLEEARRAGRQLMVAENYYYKPLTRKLRAIITSGSLGEVRFLVFNALKYQRTGDWRDSKDQAGGGALFEGGIHWINFAAGIGLTVDSVCGMEAGPGTGIERSSAVLLRYREGAVGTLLHSWEIRSFFKGLRISRVYGTEGSVLFESNGIFLVERSRRFRFGFPGFRDIKGQQAMFRDFLAAIRTGRAPEFTAERARRDLELVEQACGSAPASLSGV